MITAGNLVSSSGCGGLDITATFTYTPFVLIGSGGADTTQDQSITGTPYQEFYPGFPLTGGGWNLELGRGIKKDSRRKIALRGIQDLGARDMLTRIQPKMKSWLRAT
jgi:hypothetical protein